MKKTALLTAAAALMMATPAMAQGYVDLSYQNTDSFGSGDIETFSLGGAAALGANFQLDARYAHFDASGSADGFGVGGHLFSRGPQWLWGGYVGYVDVDGDGEWTAAAQTQFYMSRTTLSGDLLYSNVDGSSADFWALDGELRHFATDNFSIQGNLGFGQISGGGSADTWSAGVGAEWQLASAPISIYGGYQYFDIDGAPDSTNTFGIGARWNFGGQTLFERNRSGAGLGRPQGFFERLLGGANPR